MTSEAKVFGPLTEYLRFVGSVNKKKCDSVNYAIGNEFPKMLESI